jgi:hypothetical protein
MDGRVEAVIFASPEPVQREVLKRPGRQGLESVAIGRVQLPREPGTGWRQRQPSAGATWVKIASMTWAL